MNTAKKILLFMLMLVMLLQVTPIKADNEKFMDATDFVSTLIDIANNYKTLYVLGCFGAPMNASNKIRYINKNDYNKSRAGMINAASSDTFGFDCVCLIKGILWGWNGNVNSIYGGATYNTNGVPDVNANGMINLCYDVSTTFDIDSMEPGEAVWMEGHIGIYIGNGKVVESTPAWDNCVQITEIGKASGYKKRVWSKHGKLPWIDYCNHSYNSVTGLCTKCKGKFKPNQNNNAEYVPGIYTVKTDTNINLYPYTTATNLNGFKQVAVSKNMDLEVYGAVKNGFGDGWYKVRFNGNVGYINENQLRLHYSHATFSEKSYYIRNQSNGQYLTVKGSKDIDFTDVIVSSHSNETGQRFSITNSDGYSIIKPLCSSNKQLNPKYFDQINAGDKVVIASSKYEGDFDQHWCFQEVLGGYVIHNLKNPNLVLSISENGDVELAQASSILGFYDITQIWSIKEVTATVTLSSISIATEPYITTYEIGETLETDGLTLRLTYSDGSTKVVSSGFTIGGYDFSTSGEKKITVSYGGKTTTFSVTVNGTTTTQYLYSTITQDVYYIKNKSTETYLNADGTASNDNISVASFTGRAVQAFVVSGSNKSYTIAASFTEGLNLNPYTSSAVTIADVNLWKASEEEGNDQHWGFEYTEDGYYIIHNIQYESLVLCLDGTNVKVKTRTGADDQKWELVKAFDYDEIDQGTYYFYNKSNAKYMNADGTTANSTVSVAALNSKNTQQFLVSGNKKCYTVVAGFDSALRLNPYYTSTPLQGGIKIVLSSSSYESDNDQHWYFQKVSGGYILHNAKAPGLVLGVAEGKLRVEHYSGSGNQIWVLYTLTNKVTYNANGGTGAPATQDKNHGVNLTLSSAKPNKSFTVTFDADGGDIDSSSKTVYAAFKNWNTVRTGTGTAYAPGAAYSENEDVILYAQWGNAVVGQLPKPTRTNYTFTGWYLADGTTKVTENTVITENCTLTAHWEIEQYYLDLNGYLDGTTADGLKKYGTVDIYINGKLDADDITDYYTKWPVGTTYEIKDIKPTTGHTYVGIRKGVIKGTISSTTIDVVLEFKTSEYTIKYDANGGTGAPASQSKKHGEALTLSTTKPTRSGYIFAGWSTNKNAAVAAYASGETFTANENVTLYAIWNTVTVTSVSIDSMPSQTEYWVGENLNTAGLKIKVSYSDGSSKTIASNYTVSGFSSSSAGTKTVTVSYGGKTATFNVTVKAVTLSSISIKTAPSKQEYWIGETLEIAGLALIATYSDGSTKTVSSGFTTSGFNSATAGTKTVTVTYEGKTVKFTVTVKEAKLVSISIKTLPDKTEYWTGEDLDITGLTLNAVSSDGSTETVLNGFEVSGFSSGAGEKTITVTYGDKQTTFKVNVTPVVLAEITIESLPDKTVYYVGEPLETAGLKLKATSSNGKTEVLTSGYIMSGFDSDTPGTKTITVGYGGKTVNFTVTVNEQICRILFDSMGGNITPNAQSVVKGDIIILPSVIPEKSGFEFIGWATTAGADTANYQPGMSIVVNDNMQLYAVWETSAKPTDEPGSPTVLATATPVSTDIPATEIVPTDVPATDSNTSDEPIYTSTPEDYTPAYTLNGEPTVTPDAGSTSDPEADPTQYKISNLILILIAVGLLAVAACLIIILAKRKKK